MGKTVLDSSKDGFKRGAWTSHEDKLLSDYVSIYGERKWSNASKKIGLRRCGKSCRLRWLNYLRPDIKRGNISRDEEELIIRLHKLLGNRWSLIAGRLPGRTDNEIKNYWNSNLAKKLQEFQLSLPKLQNAISDNKQLLATEAAPPTSTPVVPIVQFPHENNSEGNQNKETTDEEATWPSSGDDEIINAHDFLIDFNMEDLSRILNAPENGNSNQSDDQSDHHELINGSDLITTLVSDHNFLDDHLLDWSAGMS